MLMVVIAMTRNSRLVEAITHPGDIQALKEVSPTSSVLHCFRTVYLELLPFTMDPDVQIILWQVKLALNASSIMISTCVGSWDFAFDPCDSRTSSHFTCGVDCSAPISNISRVTGLRLEPNAGYTGPRLLSHPPSATSLLYNNSQSPKTLSMATSLPLSATAATCFTSTFQ